MSCAQVMYHPAQHGSLPAPYPRTPSDPQVLGLPRMNEAMDLGFHGGGAGPPGGGGGVSGGGMKEEGVEGVKETHYLTANAVLRLYFTGDISAMVDDHFSRALSQPSSFSPDRHSSRSHSKDAMLMSGRNFPPSFWNSAATHVSSSTATMATSSSTQDLQYPTPSYLHSSLPGLSGLHPPDHWGYPGLGSQGMHYTPRHMPYDLGYPSVAHSTRFSPSYGSLLMGGGVRGGQLGMGVGGQCDLGKGPELPPRPRYPDPRLGTDFGGHGGLGGLENSVPEPGKDLYWF